MRQRDEKNIAKNLKEAYIASNKTSMEVFCECVGDLSLRSFNYYLTGKKIPKYSTLKRIADYLGKEVDELLM